MYRAPGSRFFFMLPGRHSYRRRRSTATSRMAPADAQGSVVPSLRGGSPRLGGEEAAEGSGLVQDREAVKPAVAAAGADGV